MWELIKAIFSADGKHKGGQDSLFDRVEHELKLKKQVEDNLNTLFFEQLQQLEKQLNLIFGTKGKVEAFVKGQTLRVNPIYVREWLDSFDRFHEENELMFGVNFLFGHEQLFEIVEAKLIHGQVLFKLIDKSDTCCPAINTDDSYRSALDASENIKLFVMNKVGLSCKE
ncbi:hypothetical protein F0Z19_3809 [Vibrio cyclitrophicus]|nr:hypothetical protein F0Z19_3809 [Vibrio cyclitrophicus]